MNTFAEGEPHTTLKLAFSQLALVGVLILGRSPRLR